MKLNVQLKAVNAQGADWRPMEILSSSEGGWVKNLDDVALLLCANKFVQLYDNVSHRRVVVNTEAIITVTEV